MYVLKSYKPLSKKLLWKLTTPKLKRNLSKDKKTWKEKLKLFKD